jgi:methionyl-tRNA formyltransferase
MRLLMMGTGAFAEPTFQALLQSGHQVVGLVTNPDRPSGREREMVRHIKQIAVEHGVPVFQPESVNDPEGVACVRAFQPDLLVVAAYGQILSAGVLEAAPLGGINVHASLLPKYRGAAPIAWAIYHGEKQTGVTIIRMSTKLDAGDMLAQEAIGILPDETAGELEPRLAELGAKLALQVIEQIAAGTAHGVKQDPSQVTKAPKLKKEHGLIDWTRTAEQVCCQIRAMQPWPTAYTYWHRAGQPTMRLIITKASVFDYLQEPRIVRSLLPVPEGPHLPGSVIALTVKTPIKDYDDSVLIATGDGAVRLHALQPAGKRVMTTGEFLHGHKIEVGDRLGPEA